MDIPFPGHLQIKDQGIGTVMTSTFSSQWLYVALPAAFACMSAACFSLTKVSHLLLTNNPSRNTHGKYTNARMSIGAAEMRCIPPVAAHAIKKTGRCSCIGVNEVLMYI